MPQTQPFRLERDMLDYLERALPGPLNLPDEGQWRLLREPAIGSVVPDLLIGIPRTSEQKRTRKRCTLVQTHIVAALESEGALSTRQLIKRLYLREENAHAALAQLLRFGTIIKAGPNRWAVAEAASIRQFEVVAIEAKLRRWREALDQAITYREFSDRAYVVLDGNQVRSAIRIIPVFREAGVGLFLQYGPILALEADAATTRKNICPHRVQAVDKLFGLSRTE
jgi:hypothetical protein